MFDTLDCDMRMSRGIVPALASMGCSGGGTLFNFIAGRRIDWPVSRKRPRIGITPVLAQMDGAQVAFQRGFLVVCFHPFGDP